VPAERFEKIVIFSDSKHVVDGVRSAEGSWPANDWLTQENEPVKSPELWQELVQLKRRARRVEFKKVKAHGTNPYNKRVDTLAKESAELMDDSRRAPGVARRKTTARQTEPRAVPMRGQTETIRIVSVRPISSRRHSYRYEVADEESEACRTGSTLVGRAWTSDRTLACENQRAARPERGVAGVMARGERPRPIRAAGRGQGSRTRSFSRRRAGARFRRRARGRRGRHSRCSR
jgi:hypothetical protein